MSPGEGMGHDRSAEINSIKRHLPPPFPSSPYFNFAAPGLGRGIYPMLVLSLPTAYLSIRTCDVPRPSLWGCMIPNVVADYVSFRWAFPRMVLCHKLHLAWRSVDPCAHCRIISISGALGDHEGLCYLSESIALHFLSHGVGSSTFGLGEKTWCRSKVGATYHR